MKRQCSGVHVARTMAHTCCVYLTINKCVSVALLARPHHCSNFKILMSGIDPGGGRRGRGRGRPSRMELMRRDALEAARRDMGGDAAEGPAAPLPGEVALPVEAAGPAVPAFHARIPRYAFCPPGQALSMGATHCLSTQVLRYASAAAGSNDIGQKGDEVAKFADDFWSPSGTAWHTASLITIEDMHGGKPHGDNKESPPPSCCCRFSGKGSATSAATRIGKMRWSQDAPGCFR